MAQERGGRFGQRSPAPDDLNVVQKIAPVAHIGGDGFAGVQDAAAAKGDHQVAMFLPGQGRSAADGFQIRFAGNGKNRRADAGLLQPLQQRGGAAGVPASRDQGMTPQIPGQAPGLVHRLRSEDDALRGGKFKSHVGRNVPCACRAGKFASDYALPPRGGKLMVWKTSLMRSDMKYDEPVQKGLPGGSLARQHDRGDAAPICQAGGGRWVAAGVGSTEGLERGCARRMPTRALGAAPGEKVSAIGLGGCTSARAPDRAGKHPPHPHRH